jgi:hypothetical protein
MQQCVQDSDGPKGALNAALKKHLFGGRDALAHNECQSNLLDELKRIHEPGGSDARFQLYHAQFTRRRSPKQHSHPLLVYPMEALAAIFSDTLLYGAEFAD